MTPFSCHRSLIRPSYTGCGKAHFRAMTQFRFYSSLFLALVLCSSFRNVTSFPKRTAIDSSKTKFSRKRVILHRNYWRDSSFWSSWMPLLELYMLRGSSFFLEKSCLYFWTMNSIPRYNHFCNWQCEWLPWIILASYVASLVAAPTEKAIRVATAFISIGGIAVVFFGQIRLDTAPILDLHFSYDLSDLGSYVLSL